MVPRLPTGFSCPVVLWILTGRFGFSHTGLLPSLVPLSNGFCYPLQSLCQSTTPTDRSQSVWPLPLSLAATKGIDGCFLFLRVLRCFSSPVSPRMTMDSSCGNTALPVLSFLIRTSMGQSLLAAHHGFSQLIASFFGVWCPGIHPVLLLA